MQVTVVGLGYVGLVTAACLARLGQDVIGLESDESKLAVLDAGQIPYFEPGLDAEVQTQLAGRRLRFTKDPATALAGPDAVLICVGTPSDAAGRADLRFVLDVADTIAERVEGRPVIALRSTVPVGTTRRVERRLAESLRRRGIDEGLAIISNPEFLRTGRAIDDFLRPTRIVLGRTSRATDADIARLRGLYQSLDAPMIITDAESAELVKNAANAFLATKVSFVNELAQLCDATGASIDDVMAGVSADPRIGGDYFRPGLGYGGSCLPKDVRSLIAMGIEHGQAMALAKAVDEVNREQATRYARALEGALGGDLTGKRVAILGLAFKPETDDIRDSPSLSLARAIRDRGAQVVGCDPEATERVRRSEAWLEIAETPLEAARDADAVVLGTEWPAYVTLDARSLAAAMRGRVFVDGRGAADPVAIRAAGLDYRALGRPSIEASTASS